MQRRVLKLRLRSQGGKKIDLINPFQDISPSLSDSEKEKAEADGRPGDLQAEVQRLREENKFLKARVKQLDPDAADKDQIESGLNQVRDLLFKAYRVHKRMVGTAKNFQSFATAPRLSEKQLQKVIEQALKVDNQIEELNTAAEKLEEHVEKLNPKENQQ